MRTPVAARTAALVVALLCLPLTGRAAGPSPSDKTVMNFVGADIESVIHAVGHYTGQTFIVDPRVKGTINLATKKALNKAQVLQLLASTLRLQGYAMVQTEHYIKVMPEADAKLQAPGISTGTLRGDQIATQVFPLNHESANSLVNVLRPLISPNNSISATPGNNTLVVTDYADNLRRIARVIAALDNPAAGEVEVIPLRHAIATDTATIVNRLMEQSASGSDGGRIVVIAEPRANTLILRSPNAARSGMARRLIEKLDQPTAQPGNIHVVYLKNAEAVKLAAVLRSIHAGDQAAPSASGGQAVAAAQAGGTAATGAASQANPFQGSAAGSFIQADPTTNTLIINANEQIYRNLRAVIDQLDARRAQVYVESLIVEVSADKAAELGVQWGALLGNSGGDLRVGVLNTFSTGGNNLLNLATGPTSATNVPSGGLTAGIIGQSNGQPRLALLARALEVNAKANILSMPNLITLDNEEARIIVGQNVPLITGQFTTPASSGATGVNPFQTIERRDIGLSLRVRPTISEGGTVKMAIYQETSSIQESTASGLITSKRSIDTHVLADDGQIIVLGGLIEDKVTNSTEQVPVLGSLPYLGNLFKYQKQKSEKTNLMVFLRPSVIRDDTQSLSLSRYDYIRDVQTAARPAASGAMPGLPPPLLPQRDAIERGKSLLPEQGKEK